MQILTKLALSSEGFGSFTFFNWEFDFFQQFCWLFLAFLLKVWPFLKK